MSRATPLVSAVAGVSTFLASVTTGTEAQAKDCTYYHGGGSAVIWMGHFCNDSSEVCPQLRPSIREAVRQASRIIGDDLQIQGAGYTDRDASDAYNFDLSDARRAGSERAFLNTRSISAVAQGAFCGEIHADQANKDPTNRAAIVLITEQGDTIDWPQGDICNGLLDAFQTQTLPDGRGLLAVESGECSNSGSFPTMTTVRTAPVVAHN